ncbi:MAG TPA: hypothetical protein VFS05_07940 [Gemmatimonadaceae bacterium]|nr:hypothetical protein [Gemmatimonadaceae bacterium]
MLPSTSLGQGAARAAGLALAAALTTVLAACAERASAGEADSHRAAAVADGVGVGISSSESRFVANITGGLEDPESVRYDPEQDVFFISNMAGYGSAKDDNGFIVRVPADGPFTPVPFVSGGGGVTLNAPKGMAIHGDTLWVTDIDALRGFDRHTGAPLATIDFAPLGAVQLNDVAVGPDGTLRVTDTGILMNAAGSVHVGPDRIFAVGPGGAVTVVAEGAQLRQPNGITWDSTAKRWVVVSFDPFVGEVAMLPASGGARQVVRNGKGRLDGVEALPGGALIFSSWADSSIHLLAGEHERQIIRQLPVPADIGVDTRRNRVAVPLSMLGRVELWTLGKE